MKKNMVKSLLRGVTLKMINPYPLRIDEDLMEELRILAEEHLRSVNKEIEYLIREAVRKFKEEKK